MTFRWNINKTNTASWADVIWKTLSFITPYAACEKNLYCSRWNSWTNNLPPSWSRSATASSGCAAPTEASSRAPFTPCRPTPLASITCRAWTPPCPPRPSPSGRLTLDTPIGGTWGWSCHPLAIGYGSRWSSSTLPARGTPRNPIRSAGVIWTCGTGSCGRRPTATAFTGNYSRVTWAFV